jgi:hypothetical protein
MLEASRAVRTVAGLDMLELAWLRRLRGLVLARFHAKCKRFAAREAQTPTNHDVPNVLGVHI